jgi:DNA-binding transcriptional MerR regulator
LEFNPQSFIHNKFYAERVACKQKQKHQYQSTGFGKSEIRQGQNKHRYYSPERLNLIGLKIASIYVLRLKKPVD